MAGTEGTVNYPTDNASRHAIGLYEDGAGFFYWLRCTVGKLLKTVIPGAPNYATNQVATSTTAATLLAARAARRAVLFTNIGTTRVYVGPATVTAANGYPLDPGSSVVMDITTLIQAIAASGTPTVAYVETYD